MPGAQHFDYWWTSREDSTDRRTGAYAILAERPRHTDDPASTEHKKTVWAWMVILHGVRIADGVRATQGAARKAVRKIAEKLPDKSEEKKCKTVS